MGSSARYVQRVLLVRLESDSSLCLECENSSICVDASLDHGVAGLAFASVSSLLERRDSA